MDRRTRSRVGVLVALAVVALIAGQPLGVLWHVIDDHLDGHAHATHDHAAVEHGGHDAPDHDADHPHVWMTPASAAVGAQLGQPYAVAPVAPRAEPAVPSAPPFPPFSPPRA